MASLTAGSAIAACAPKAPPNQPVAPGHPSGGAARDPATSTGAEGSVSNCGGVVCPANSFCDTRTSSQPRCHSQLPYVGRPFDHVVATLLSTVAWVT